MGINLNGRSINGDGITQDKFNEILKNSNYSEKEKKAALDIFTKFAAMDNDKTTLSADEAKLAFAELEKLNTDNDNDVSKKELKQGKNGSDYQKALAEAGKSAVELFYSKISGNTDVHLSKDEDGNTVVTTLNDKNTVPTKDDDFKMTVYGDKGEVKHDDKHEEPPKITNDDIQKTFLKYITNSKDFDGVLFGENTLNGFFAGDNPQLKVINENGKVGIEYNGKMYNMRGKDGDIRFEYDGEGTENKGAETLQQAILNSNSDDAVHKYHNHGEAINSGSTYDVATGTISHGTNKDSVSQSQTFASMLMNGNENSTLTLDKQRSKDGSFETTAEHIIKTLDSKDSGGKSDDEISMKELISYLKAVEVESNGLNENQATGARRFAKGVDLDLKDLANIGAVFKKYDTTGNGKLDKNELQNLLNDFKKKNSMSKLAQGVEIAKYKGPDKTNPTDNDSVTQPRARTANRTRNEVDIKGNKTGEKIQYDYENGLRTVVKDGKEDLEGNIAEESDPSFGVGKKRFVYIEGLPIEVRAELKLDEESKSKIVEVKDRNGSVRYYKVNISKTEGKDDTYKLGDELVKNGKKMVSRQQLTDDICKQLGIRGENIKLPDNITAEYGKNGKMTFKLNGRICNSNFARVAIMRANSEAKGLDDGQRSVTISGKSIPSQLNYVDNQLNSRDIDISNSELYADKSTGWKLRDYLKKNSIMIDNKEYNVSSTKIVDKSGNVLVEYRNGKFIDAKGKEIHEDKIVDLLNKANDKNNLARIVQNF